MTILRDRLRKLFGFGDTNRGDGKKRRVQLARPSLELLETRDLMSGDSLVGAVVHQGTVGSTAAPAIPVLTATAASSSQINLAWNAVAGADGYLVKQWVAGTWQQIASLGSDAISDAAIGLNAGSTYYFDVVAYNSAGSSWANYKSATTLQNSPPAAPSFTATGVSATQIKLAWNAVSGTNGYLVEEWVAGAWQQIASLGSGTISDTMGGLNQGTTYYFRVAAYNASGTTWAAYQGAATQAAISINHPGAATAYAPAGGSLFGANGPSYLDVEQGDEGDCWLMSSLAEVAARAPADIKNMFTYDGTTTENGATVGLYTVRFFNGKGVAQYVKVDTELPSGGNYYDHPANGVLWVALAEKAYAQANGAGIVTSQNEGVDTYDALNGGDPTWALQAITGKAATDYAINPTNVAAAWNAGELVVLCTNSPASPYVVPDHCYAVVGYNASSSLPFQIYNPWGTNSSGLALGTFDGNQVYGLFNASAKFVSNNFANDGIGNGTANR